MVAHSAEVWSVRERTLLLQYVPDGDNILFLVYMKLRQIGCTGCRKSVINPPTTVFNLTVGVSLLLCMVERTRDFDTSQTDSLNIPLSLHFLKCDHRQHNCVK